MSDPKAARRVGIRATEAADDGADHDRQCKAHQRAPHGDAEGGGQGAVGPQPQRSSQASRWRARTPASSPTTRPAARSRCRGWRPRPSATRPPDPLGLDSPVPPASSRRSSPASSWSWFSAWFSLTGMTAHLLKQASGDARGDVADLGRLDAAGPLDVHVERPLRGRAGSSARRCGRPSGRPQARCASRRRW